MWRISATMAHFADLAASEQKDITAANGAWYCSSETDWKVFARETPSACRMEFSAVIFTNANTTKRRR